MTRQRASGTHFKDFPTGNKGGNSKQHALLSGLGSNRHVARGTSAMNKRGISARANSKCEEPWVSGAGRRGVGGVVGGRMDQARSVARIKSKERQESSRARSRQACHAAAWGSTKQTMSAVSHSRTSVPWFWKHLMEGRYGLSDLVGWRWLLRFQKPRSREHSRALQKQMLTHGQAKLTAPTSEGTVMSSLGLYYSYTVQPTCLKINTSEG